jgi:Spy/CpxP family protein refolding chaperone
MLSAHARRLETHPQGPSGGKIMRYSVALLAAVCLFNVVGVSGIAAQQAQPASTTPAAMDEMLAAVRSDVLATRADVMAKNLSMTAEQAAKFWPVYDAYQKEQNTIMEDHLKGIQRYIESIDTLDDAGALALIKAHLDRDERMNILRQKALGDLQRVVGTKLAARAIQIDRRLSLAYQLQIVSKIPLIH